jgi:hypothetical protein
MEQAPQPPLDVEEEVVVRLLDVAVQQRHLSGDGGEVHRQGSLTGAALAGRN